jgi:raffinose/stachyose/melibiose transport system permease protein
MSANQLSSARVAETATLVQPRDSSGKKKTRLVRSSRFRVPVWFVLPALALYILAMLYPLASGAVLAFTDWNGLSSGWNFTWFDNFVRVATDPSALRALGNQLLIAITFPILQNVAGLGLAVALNSRIKSRFVLRTIFFTPAVLTPVILAFLWQYIYSNNGTLNSVLDLVGLDALKQSWLGDPKLALWAIIIVITWQYTGYSMVIYLAGLQGVPKEILEAAEVDGASRFQSFFKVTFPLLAPSVTINIILSSVIGLKVFDQVYAMTGGGPGDATQTLTVYQYLRAFNYGEFGYGTAVALVLALIVSLVSALQYKFLRRNEEAAS